MSQDLTREENNSSASQNSSIVSSGNAPLDQILGGGIPRGSLLMLVGAPGTGKTTLALQMCFQWTRSRSNTTTQSASQSIAKTGNSGAGRSIYFSLLSESHDKLIAHASQFGFFEPEQLNDTVKFFSLSSQLEKSSKEVLDFIVKTIRQEKAGLVVIDGFTALAEMFASRAVTRQFLYTLSSQLTFLGATALTSIERPADGRILSDGDLTVADGVISFTSRLDGAGEYFALQVVKLRGMKRLLGLQSYAITGQGLEFYPRLEALVKGGFTVEGKTPFPSNSSALDLQQNWSEVTSDTESATDKSPQSQSQPRKTFGLAELEQMLGGGLPAYSSTLVAGSVGVGKTLLGVHFLVQGVRQGEKRLYLGFYEDKAALFRKARDFGMDLQAAYGKGQVELLTIPPLELEPDQVMQQLRQSIEGKGISRLVVDGFNELERACRSTSRSHNFAAAFEVYLKQQNVTVIYTHSISKVVGTELDLSDTPFTRMAENLLLMRQGEYNNLLYRIISILKMRDSDYDRSIKEFTVSDGHGIKVLGAAQSIPGLLSGLARKLDNNNSVGDGDGGRSGSGRNNP